MKTWVKFAVLAVVIIAAAISVVLATRTINRLTAERDKYRNNTETLMRGVEQYKLRDSLNAARVQTLELTIRDFERLRGEDAELIRELRIRTRDLASINKTQAETIIKLSAIPRDTVIIKDSVAIPAVSVHCGDFWYDFDGLLTKDEFSGNLRNRDSLVLVESVEYKRFLGFLWRTKQIKRKSMDVVSKNPHTAIIGVEYLQIAN